MATERKSLGVRRRWFRLSLRTFFVFVTVVCVALGLYVKRQRDRHIAIETIKNWGGVVEFVEPQPLNNQQRTMQVLERLRALGEAQKQGQPRPEFPEEMPQGKAWQRRMLGTYGKYHGSSVIHIQLGKSAFASQGVVIDFSVISPLTEVKRLTLSNVDEHATTGFPRLSKLESLHLMSGEIRDSTLESLRRMPRLTNLQVMRGTLTSKGLAHIGASRELTALMLNGCDLSDEGFSHLVALKKLKSLSLDKSNVSDAAIAYLREMQSLTSFSIEYTDISLSGATELSKALPNCRIKHDYGFLETE